MSNVLYNVRVCWQWEGCNVIRRRAIANTPTPCPLPSRCPTTPSEILADAASWTTCHLKDEYYFHYRKKWCCKELTRESEVPVWAPFSAWWERGRHSSHGVRTRRRAARDCRDARKRVRACSRRMCTATRYLFCSATPYRAFVKSRRKRDYSLV